MKSWVKKKQLSFDVFVTMKGGKGNRMLSKVVPIKADYPIPQKCVYCVCCQNIFKTLIAILVPVSPLQLEKLGAAIIVILFTCLKWIFDLAIN